MLFPLAGTARNPDKVAFEMCESGEQVTYRQLDQRANQVAQVVRQLGIQAGDHVAIVLKNERRFLETCFGMDRAGVYYTTVNARLTMEEIAYIVRDCGARLLLVSAELPELASALIDTFSNQFPCFVVGSTHVGGNHWDRVVDAAPIEPIADACQGLDMLYSSGTTGRPKGVKWPRPDVPAGQATMLVQLLGPLFSYGPDCNYLSPAPLYHAAPLRHCMTVIKLGGTVHVMESFDAWRALQIIEARRITHAQWVPTMFVRMLKLPDSMREAVDVSSLRVAIHAAAPCPVDVKDKMLAWWGPILVEYYAGTENNGFCCITSEEWMQHRGSVGRATQGRLHICNEMGEELPAGETGLVYFSDGPQFSYHQDPERTALAMNDRGWSTLGDIGRLDEQGYLYLVDRKSFMIISGGVNIYPQEIEDLLLSHPKVLDVAVIGVPNDDLGEEVKAVVQPMAAEDATPELGRELVEYCQQHLARFKCPRSIDFDLNLPRHPTGKLYKRAVRDRYWPAKAGLTR
jgi:fatty-acyl-CoA synthase